MEQNDDERKLEEFTKQLGELEGQYIVMEIGDLFASLHHAGRSGLVKGFLAGAAIATIIGWLV